MRLQLTITGIALLSLPVMAEAQATSRAEGNTSVRTEADQGTTRAAGSAALQATIAADLPEEPVRRLIAEGEAKGASRSTIERAAMSTFTRLRVARETLEGGARRGHQASDAEILAGADAMAAGATRAELASIRDATSADRSLTASLRALTELRARGVAGTEAASAIAARLASGASDQAIAAFAASVQNSASLRLGAVRGSASGALDAATSARGAVAGVGTTVGVGASVAGSVGGGIFR